MTRSESEAGRQRVEARKPRTAYQRHAAAIALASALEPVVDLCLELGISSPEMERVLRSVFANRATELLSSGSRRAGPASATRVGLMIGLHRNVIRAIRTTKPRAQLEKVKRRYRGAALLEAWAGDWEYLTTAGQPRDLPLHARSGEPSFEALVRRYMPGISTGTAVAELRRSGAIRLLPDELIRLRSRTPRPPGISAADIQALSERMREVAATLLHNLKTPDDMRFCESLDEVDIGTERLAVVNQIIARRSRSFMAAIAAELAGQAQASDHKSPKRKLGLMVCAYEKLSP